MPADDPAEAAGTPEDRPLAEDLALPVVVQPGVDYATPPDWIWRDVDSTQPNSAVFHISHSEVTPVLVDSLGPEDCAPDGQRHHQKRNPHHHPRQLGQVLGRRGQAAPAPQWYPRPRRGPIPWPRPNAPSPPTWPPSSASC